MGARRAQPLARAPAPDIANGSRSGGIRLRVMRRAISVGPCLGGAAVGYVLVVRGALTLDLGLGRRLRPLGPLRVSIGAPRETVFDVIAAPYLGRTPRAVGAKLEVLEHGSDMVLATHFTPLTGGFAP